MERKQTTRPRTGTLDDLVLGHTALGLRATGRDERDAVDGEDRVLIVLAGHHRQTVQIADALTAHLTREHLVVERALLEAGSPPPLEDYDAVVVGAPVLLGRHARAVADYLCAQEAALAELPGFLFVVGGPGLPGSADYLERMTRRTGWHPVTSVAFEGDAPPASQVGALARRIADGVPVAVLRPTLA